MCTCTGARAGAARGQGLNWSRPGQPSRGGIVWRTMASEPSNGLVVPKRRSTLGKPPRKSSISKVQRVHTRTEYIHAPSGPHTQHTLLSTFSRRSRNKRRPHLQREIKSRRSVSWVQNLAESSKISPLRFRCFEDCDSEFLMVSPNILYVQTCAFAGTNSQDVGYLLIFKRNLADREAGTFPPKQITNWDKKKGLYSWNSIKVWTRATLLCEKYLQQSQNLRTCMSELAIPSHASTPNGRTNLIPEAISAVCAHVTRPMGRKVANRE